MDLQNLCYAEIRFAPQLHTAGGLSQKQVVRAAVSGLLSGIMAFDMPAQLILCCMRGDSNLQDNLETFDGFRRKKECLFSRKTAEHTAVSERLDK